MFIQIGVRDASKIGWLTNMQDAAALHAQLRAREQECVELRHTIDESAKRHTDAVMALRATHARTVAELQQSEATAVALAKMEAQQVADAAHSKLQARLNEAECHIAELTKDLERKDTLLAMHQKRERPKETFASCVDELKATHARLAATREANGLKSALAASEAREADLHARCDALQLSLEAAQRESFQATTQCQARERELRRALSQTDQQQSSQQQTVADHHPTKAAATSVVIEDTPGGRPPARRAASFARVQKRREPVAAAEGECSGGSSRKQLTRAASFMRGGSSKRKRVV